jgi:hypothetical protein
MAKPKSKSQPTWTDVKAKLADFDRAALLGLIQSLYAAHKDNQTFLHARFGLAADALEPYKKAIDRFGSETPTPLEGAEPQGVVAQPRKAETSLLSAIPKEHTAQGNALDSRPRYADHRRRSPARPQAK